MNPARSPFAPSRRQFVSAAAAAALMPQCVASAFAAAPGAASASVALRSDDTTCLHVFSKPLHFLDYRATAELVAEAGFGGIDFSVRRGGHVEPARVRDDLPRAVEAAHAFGLRVEMITTGILRADDKDTAAVLETAAKLGVKFYRLGWFNYDPHRSPWQTIETLKPVMRDLAALNRHYGLHGAYQNHSGLHVGAAGWDLFELLRDLDPQWIGCQFDIRHATTDGGLCWPNTLRLLAPWIRCADVKDFRWLQAPGKARVEGMPIGEGIVDFAAYFQFRRTLAISGPMSVHFEYPPFEGGPAGLGKSARRDLLGQAMAKDAASLRRLMEPSAGG